MHLEKLLQVVPQLWKALVPDDRLRLLPQVLADDELGVDEFQGGIRIADKLGM